MFKTGISETVSADSSFKALGYLYESFEISEKGNIGTRKRMSAKSVKSVQKTSDNAGGKHTRGFSLQHETFSALNYAQDFGTTVKEWLKRTTSSK